MFGIFDNFGKKYVASDSFEKNVVTLVTGSTMAQFIPVALSPILTRIYSPQDFGVLALFVSVTAVLGFIASGKYEFAIMLPEDENDAAVLTLLSFTIAAGFSLLILALVPLINNFIENGTIRFWLYIAPFSIFLFGVYNALKYLNIRNRLYSNISRANVYAAVICVIFQIPLGFLNFGESGLLTGFIVSQITGNAILAKGLLAKKELFKKHGLCKFKQLSLRYIDFPKYQVLGTLSNKASLTLSDLFISVTYNLSSLGFYSLVNKVLGFPSAFVGQSVSDVFYQKASEEKQKSNSATKIFNSTLKRMSMVSLPFFLILFFTCADVFAFVFGEEWRMAGEYTKILLPVFLLRFIAVPLGQIFFVYEKQKWSLLFQLVFLLITVLTICLSFYFDFGIKKYLYALSASWSLSYLFMLFLSWKICKGKI